MRVMGLDFGTRRIGVALGDTESRIASPWRVVDGEDRNAAITLIGKIAAEEGVGRIIIGMPRPLRDQEAQNEQVETVQRFVEDVRALSYPVELMDETLSSRAAAVLVRDGGGKGKRDDIAAAVILQSWLDAHTLA